jgi:hypothetical protein
MRGRELIPEEIRAYLEGDDNRTIDRKVAARRRNPSVRVHAEERDHPGMAASRDWVARAGATIRVRRLIPCSPGFRKTYELPGRPAAL